MDIHALEKAKQQWQSAADLMPQLICLINEEGRLIHLGILAQSSVNQGKMLLIDLGGGSCELTLSERGHIREMTSLPLRAVRLTQEFLRHDPPQSIELPPNRLNHSDRDREWRGLPAFR